MGCALHPSQTSQEPTPCRYKTKARLISHSLFLREIAQGPSAAADSPHWTAPRSSAESSLYIPANNNICAYLPKGEVPEADFKGFYVGYEVESIFGSVRTGPGASD